jgi:hypothetical protein
MKELALIPDILALIVRGLNLEEKQTVIRDLETLLLPEEIPLAKKTIQSAISAEEWAALQQC